MGRIVFLEVLDRRGRLKSRSRLASFPVSIGRSYKNDVIVDDRYVSPEHVRILEGDDGRLVAEDLGSVNGLRLSGSPDKLPRVELRSGLKVKIGETVLRVVEEDAPVPEAQPLIADSRGLLHFLRFKPLSLGIIAVSFGITVLDAYLETYQEMRWVDVLGVGLGALVAMLLWAGVWAFTNRLLTHRFDFARHLAFAYLMVTLAVVVEPAYEYFRFFSNSQSSLLAYAGGGLCLALLVMGHLSIIPSLARWRRAAWSLGVAAAAFGAARLMQYSGESHFSSQISFSMPLKALGADWLPTTDLKAFLDESRQLQDDVDALAKEE
ncbi:MAG TPA: FHA domain-containing protein [Vicinamibacteria bacterium]|nr:FHA domain-containing protein [Vicinamibacteria bacterium]